MNKEIGRPAFPVPGLDRNLYNNGMTLRDYFAAKALQGLLAAPNRSGSFDEYSNDAYGYADAMLEARNA